MGQIGFTLLVRQLECGWVRTHIWLYSTIQNSVNTPYLSYPAGWSSNGGSKGDRGVQQQGLPCRAMGRRWARTCSWHSLWQALVSFCLTLYSLPSQLAKQERDKNLFRPVIMALLIADRRVYNKQDRRYKGSSSLSDNQHAHIVYRSIMEMCEAVSRYQINKCIC